MGCGASARYAPPVPASAEAQQQIAQQQRQLTELRSQLALSKQQLAEKDAELVKVQERFKRAQGQRAIPDIDIEKLEHFLFKGIPAAYHVVQDMSKHGVCNTDVLEQKLRDAENDASALREIVEQHQQEVHVQCKDMTLESEKLDLEVSAMDEILDLSKWLTEELVALTIYEFKVVQASKLREWSGGPLPHYQELDLQWEGGLKTVRVSIRDFCSGGASLTSILAVSHRWVRSDSPDPEGEKQAAIVEHLNKHPEIEYVWLDWWCVPQGERDKIQQDCYDKTLEHVYMLFLGAQVLLLVDVQSLSRFWTSYEAWLSMRVVSSAGLDFDDRLGDRRVTIQCLGVAENMEQSLRDMWGPLTSAEAYEKLCNDNFEVTIQQDKDQQLDILKCLAYNLTAQVNLLQEIGGGRHFKVVGRFASVKDIKLTILMVSGDTQVDDHGETVTVRYNTKLGAVMSSDPLPTDRPTCFVATFSYSSNPGYWTPVGVQRQRANASHVDFYCDFAFDTYPGYSGGNANGGYSNVTFGDGFKPTMGNGDSGTFCFDPAQRRMLCLQHATQKVGAFVELDLSSPFHLHFATYVAGNAITLREPTKAEIQAVCSASDVAEADASKYPITRV